MSASGNYTLFVQVDVYDSIDEASVSDKVSAPVSGTFTLTPPDLLPISVTAPPTVAATNVDPMIKVSWAVTNQGTGLASGGWYDRVWFSTDGLLDASSTDIGDFYISQTVPVGGSYAQTNTVTLPITLGWDQRLHPLRPGQRLCGPFRIKLCQQRLRGGAGNADTGFGA